MKKSAVLLLVGLALSSSLSAQEPPSSFLLSMSGAGSYHMTERSDWARYDNGVYIGHVYREVRANIRPAEAEEGFRYRGDFFVLEETLRDSLESAHSIDAVVPATFTVSRDGSLSIQEDKGFPSLRGFPAFPSTAVTRGTKWTAQGKRAVDPRASGTVTILPLIAEFTYTGTEMYKGEKVHRIQARYATRYKAPKAADFTGAQGSHEVDILLRADNGLPVLMRDRLDETFTWADGSTVRFKGFTLTFSEGYLPRDTAEVVQKLRETIPVPDSEPSRPAVASQGGDNWKPLHDASPQEKPGSSELPAPTPLSKGPAPQAAGGDFELSDSGPGAKIEIETTDLGVKLILKDLHFAPDTADFLADEAGRLDLIAQALLAQGDRQILVEGHTASTGKPRNEQDLSERRAKRTVEELTRRGVPASRCIYKGWGSTKPLDSNETEAGKARNRRVEITLLN